MKKAVKKPVLKKHNTSARELEPQFDFHNVPGKDIQRLFGVTRKTIYEWVDKGCPKNKDSSFDSALVFDWYVAFTKSKYDSEDPLKDQKTRAEIRLKEAQITKIQMDYIERRQHELILASRIKTLSLFLEQTMMNNAHHFVGLTIDESRVKLHDFVKRMMIAYVGSIADK